MIKCNFHLSENVCIRSVSKVWYGGINAVKNLIVPGTKLSKDKGGVRIDETLLKQVVGSLMYLTVTRSDLMYGVSLISRFMSSPTMSH